MGFLKPSSDAGPAIVGSLAVGNSQMETAHHPLTTSESRVVRSGFGGAGCMASLWFGVGVWGLGTR